MQAYLLVARPLAGVQWSAGVDRVHEEPVEPGHPLRMGDGPTVLVLDTEAANRWGSPALEQFVNAGGSLVWTETDGPPPATLPVNLVAAFVPCDALSVVRVIAVRSGIRESASRIDNQRLRRETALRTAELDELARIGMALNTERDYGRLLDVILYQARRLTRSDAGSLYLVQRNRDGGSPHLVLKWAQNHSRPDIPFQEYSMPLDQTSIAGHVVSTGEPVAIADAYHLAAGAAYTFNRSLDIQHHYRTRSILTLPMINHDNDVIGALQLINRKRHFDSVLQTPDDIEREVVTFSPRAVELVSALAGQAAVSLDNSQLLEERERLFERFVAAAVRAIEQRDPDTYGHSGRVTTMTLNIARAVSALDSGPFRDVCFTEDQLREIQYATQLHDFGKVAVPEVVLRKAKKLYDHRLDLIKERYAFIHRTLERDHFRRLATHLEQQGPDAYDAMLEVATRDHEQAIRRLDRLLELVVQSNEPTVFPVERFDELIELAQTTYRDFDGRERTYLADEEIRHLTIRRGTLDDVERQQIQHHVEHSYEFLRGIPWTRELSNVPEIAYAHHEKMDGSGYPRGIGSDQLLLQTRMLTIADVFDALTGSDRPYKPALPVEQALRIMAHEVAHGRLDRDLFEIFVRDELYAPPGAGDAPPRASDTPSTTA